MKAWDVYLEDKHGTERVIDTVFYDSDCTPEYVLDGLINHDGYNPNISVWCNETGEHYPKED